MDYHRTGLMITAFSGMFFLVLTVASSFILHACSNFENPHSYYETYEDAIKDGAVERGWIPGFVPSSATHIEEQHDLDTNTGWIDFQAVPTDVRNMLNDTEIQPNPVTHEIPGGPDWVSDKDTPFFLKESSGLNYKIYVSADFGRVYITH